MKMKDWDVCPECGARRIVVCRYCNTIGDNFPLADLDLILPAEHAESLAENYNTEEDAYDDGEEVSIAEKSFLADSLGSAFGGGGANIQTVQPEESADANKENQASQHKCGGQCHCSHEMVKLTKPIDDAPEIDENAEEYPLAVQCPCCDEVLYPQFLKVCKKCGHEFEDGIDEETIPDAHFYVPGEYDSQKDEDEDEDDDQPGAAGCCVLLFALTAMSLLWKFFC